MPDASGKAIHYDVTYVIPADNGLQSDVTKRRNVSVIENYTTFASIPTILAVYEFGDRKATDRIVILSAILHGKD